MAEKTPQPTLNLFLHSSEWGLPSVDPESLGTLLYLRACGIPHQLNYTPYPYSSVTGTLPYLQWGEEITDDVNILSHLRKNWCDLDEFRTPIEHADIDAYLLLIQENIYFPLLYFQWHNEDAFQEVTQFAYARAVSFPVKIYLRWARRKQVAQWLKDRKLDAKRAEEVGVTCLRHLSERLGDQHFFFSNRRPSTLDIFLAAHLAVVYHFPWSNPLKRALASHRNLIQHFLYILTAYGTEYTVPGEIAELQDRTRFEIKKNEAVDLYTPKVHARKYRKQEVKEEKRQSEQEVEQLKAVHRKQEKSRYNIMAIVVTAVVVLSFVGLTSRERSLRHK